MILFLILTLMFQNGIFCAYLCRFNQADAISDTLAGNIKSCAMINRTADKRQAPCNRYSLLKIQRLAGNMPLIVIHRKNSIEFTGFTNIKNRIRRYRPHRIDALGLCGFNSRNNFINLFTSKQTIIAVMRINTGNCNNRIFNSYALQFFIDIADKVEHNIFFGKMYCINQ